MLKRMRQMINEKKQALQDKKRKLVEAQEALKAATPRLGPRCRTAAGGLGTLFAKHFI